MKIQKVLLTIFCSIFLIGCASLPKEYSNKTEFKIETEQSYIQAYSTISRQMTACYRAIGPLGNGFDVQSLLNTEKHVGTIEIYYVGIAGADKSYLESNAGRFVTVSQQGEKALVRVQATKPIGAYRTHNAIQRWLRGETTCSGAQLSE